MPLAFPRFLRSNAKRQLKAALAERDAQAQRVNELSQQLQDKKRQLFSAIQVRGGSRWWMGTVAQAAVAALSCPCRHPPPPCPTQEREGLRQQNRALEDKCREFQEALQCKLCRAVRPGAAPTCARGARGPECQLRRAARDPGRACCPVCSQVRQDCRR